MIDDLIIRLEKALAISIDIEMGFEELRDISPCKCLGFTLNVLQNIRTLYVTLDIALEDTLVANPLLIYETRERVLIGRKGILSLIGLDTCNNLNDEGILCISEALYNGLQHNSQIIVHNLATTIQSLIADCHCIQKGGPLCER